MCHLKTSSGIDCLVGKDVMSCMTNPRKDMDHLCDMEMDDGDPCLERLELQATR